MIHNRPIYHCQSCGAVITQEPHRLPPFCCHQVMVKAAEETLREDFTPTQDGDPVPNGQESDRIGLNRREIPLSVVNEGRSFAPCR